MRTVSRCHLIRSLDIRLSADRLYRYNSNRCKTHWNRWFSAWNIENCLRHICVTAVGYKIYFSSKGMTIYCLHYLAWNYRLSFDFKCFGNSDKWPQLQTISHHQSFRPICCKLSFSQWTKAVNTYKRSIAYNRRNIDRIPERDLGSPWNEFAKFVLVGCSVENNFNPRKLDKIQKYQISPQKSKFANFRNGSVPLTILATVFKSFTI